MILYRDESVIVCGPGAMEVVRDERDGNERWCFKCRKRREFRLVVTQAVDWENDWYGPNSAIRCSSCKTTDGDCFPGSYRMWGDD